MQCIELSLILVYQGRRKLLRNSLGIRSQPSVSYLEHSRDLHTTPYLIAKEIC